MRLILLTALFFLGNWMLDIGQNTTMLTNGLWRIDSVTAMHLGWYAGIIAFMITVAYAYRLEKKLEVYEMGRMKKKKKTVKDEVPTAPPAPVREEVAGVEA